MWIRNQDKDRVVKVNDNKWDYDTHEKIYNIVGLSDTWMTLGEYLTHDRVIEVIDDITNVLLMCDSPNVIYNMPQWY